MKKQLLALLMICSIQAHGNELDLNFPLFPDRGNPELVPVEEDPGPNAEIRDQIVHDKTITVPGSELRFKWTSLGYGSMTYKMIIPSLAAHTLFDHRNPGEEGPCLRSYRRFPDAGQDTVTPETIDIKVSASNRYLINRERKICKVLLVEHVEAVLGEEVFDHTYTKDMGFRYIEDCLVGE